LTAVTFNHLAGAGLPRRGPSGDSVVRIVPLAAVGVVLGHLLTYAIAVPDARERSGILARTGHAYFPVFAEYALVVGAATLAAWLIASLRPGRPIAGAGDLVRVLAPVQAVVFVCLEIGERAVAGASFADLLGLHLVVGVLLQVVVATAVARVVAALTRAAAERLTGPSDRRPPQGTRPVGVGAIPRPATQAVLAVPPARAPPLPVDA
jgi:hypothetical protein